MSGWIRLHRSSFDNRLYFSEPFTRWQAWCDLLLLANHKEGWLRKRGIREKISRGQTGFSMVELAKRWRWSKGKVIRFLNELEIDKQIVLQKTNITTLISIVNYEMYQSSDTANEFANSTANRFANGLQTGSQTDTNKNDKNNKEEKEDRGKGDLASPQTPPKVESVFKAADGSLVKVATLEYSASDFNGLPDKYAMLISNNLRTVKQIDVTKERLDAAWDSFKSLEIHKKLYRNEEDVYSFFSNYCKRQSWAKSKEDKATSISNGKVVGIEFINDFNDCRMSDGTIKKLSINQQDSARYNHINPKAIVK